VAIEIFEIIQIFARGNGQKQIFSKIQQTWKKAILNHLSLTKAKKGLDAIRFVRVKPMNQSQKIKLSTN
jgi:hypothetical protein